MEGVTNKHIEWAQEAVSASPFSVEPRLELIKLLRQLGGDEQEEARHDAADTIAMPESFWLEWLKEHTQALLKASTGEEKQDHQRTLSKLYEAAVMDCPTSTALWSGSAVAAQMSGKGFEEIRAHFEKAVVFVGHHVQEGHKIWREYIDWEEEVSSAMEAMGQLDETVLTKQTERIRNLYSRCFSAPLAKSTELWEEYEEWEEDEKKIVGLKKRREGGVKQFKSRQKHEAKIEKLLAGDPDASADAVLYKDAVNYIAFEETQLSGKKQKGVRDVKSGISLFERVLSVFSTASEIWMRYLSFLKKYASDHLLYWAKVAARKCYWSGTVLNTASWVRISNGSSAEEEIASLEAAMVSGKVSTADDYHAVYCNIESLTTDEERRKALSEEHQKSIMTYFRSRTDLQADLLRIQLARLFKQADVDQQTLYTEVCRLWDASLKLYGHTLWLSWSSYLNDLEKVFQRGDCSVTYEDAMRTVFKRAVGLVTDFSDVAFSAWKAWERLNGDVTTRLAAGIIMEKRSRVIAKMRAKWEASYTTQAVPVAVESQAKVTTTQSRTLFVKNINFDIDETKLKEFFETVAPVNEIRLQKNENGESRGFAFVEFATEEGASAGLLMNGKEIKNRAIVVSRSTSGIGQTGIAGASTIFVTNLPYDVTKEEVVSALETAKVPGSVRKVRLLTDREGKGRGSGFVEFEGSAPLDILKYNGLLRIKGRAIKVEIAKTKSRAELRKGRAERSVQNELEESGEAYDDSKTVFIGSLPETITDTQIRDAFSPCGAIESIRLIQARGKGFVDFQTSDGRAAALELNKKLIIDGKTVEVSVPKPRFKRPPKDDKPKTFAPVTSLVPPSIARRRKKLTLGVKKTQPRKRIDSARTDPPATTKKRKVGE